jgi:hypothetical protein
MGTWPILDPITRRLAVPRWFVILSVIAVLAFAAGFMVFGGGNMGN